MTNILLVNEELHCTAHMYNFNLINVGVVWGVAMLIGGVGQVWFVPEAILEKLEPMGMGKQAITFYKCLASVLAEKWGQSYTSTLCWLRCCISFIRSAIQ